MNWEEGSSATSNVRDVTDVSPKEEGRRKRKKHLIVDIEGARCVPSLSLPAGAKQSQSREIHLPKFGKGRCARRTLG
ncbi:MULTISPECIES: hypothetical protein [unclassified Microcoleus]|uniref:hypothetical protein n=1 Tax=unclassified Microcoleus TaxID=2642155 RepID=UPI002FD21ACA